MNYGSYLANGFRMLAFKQDAVAAIRDDNDTTRNGLITLALISAIAGLFMALIAMVMSRAAQTIPELSGAFPPVSGGSAVSVFIVWALISFASAIIVYGIIHLLAKLLKGSASFGTFLGTMAALSFALMVIQVPVVAISRIPYLGQLLSLALFVYGAILQVFVIRETHGFETWRAAVAYLVPIAVAFILVFSAMLYLLMPVAMP